MEQVKTKAMQVSLYSNSSIRLTDLISFYWQQNVDNKMRNFNSWSSLAQNANSTNASNPNKQKNESNDPFQQFKRVAKEKSDRQKQILEQQKLQNERLEKERLRAEKAKQEKEALARKSGHLNINAISAGMIDDNSPLGSCSPASGSSSPAQSINDRDAARRREQERRRREAVSVSKFTL